MVKAGIFLMARLWPVLAGTPESPDWSSSLRTECVPADPRPQVLARYREVRPWST